MALDLNKVVKALKKDYGSCKIGNELPDKFEMVSTGNLAFDLISDGGIPFGYVVELLGLSSSGKSLFIHNVVASAQKDYDAVGILIDRENAYTKRRGIQLGIDNSKFLIATPADTPTPLSAFQFITDTITKIREQDKDTYIVIAIDSIAAFDKDVALEKSDSGRKAKSIHEGLRSVLPLIDSHIMLLVANQVTYSIGVMYGDNKTSTAGTSMKYYSTVRFALEDRKKIIDVGKGNEVIGNWIGIEVIKTRLGPCYRSCYLQHFYKTGIDWWSGYARLLADRGYLEPKNKSEFKSFKQKTLIYRDSEKFSEDDIESFIKKHPELMFKTYPDYYEEKNDKTDKSVESNKK